MSPQTEPAGTRTQPAAPLVDLARTSAEHLALALADQHARAPVDACIWLRLSPRLDEATAGRLLTGAGFARVRHGPSGRILVRRLHTLPDYVGPELRLLICGLNPSPYAADTGVPFGRPGNRFWPAAHRAGLVDRDRDCRAALARGVGFTDLVKRVTRRASELTAKEYREGLDRIDSLAWQLRPRVVCFVGLDGYRRATRRASAAGWMPEAFGPSLAYLMPSTSGLNAHATLEALVEHLRRAAHPSALDPG